MGVGYAEVENWTFYGEKLLCYWTRWFYFKENFCRKLWKQWNNIFGCAMSDSRQKLRLSRVTGSSALWALWKLAGRDACEATLTDPIMLHANEMQIVASWDSTGWKIEKLFFFWSELQCQGITEKRQKFFETLKHSLWVHLKDEMITIRALWRGLLKLKLNLKRLTFSQLGRAAKTIGARL